MNLKFIPGYRPENTKYFGVHHFGGVAADKLASTQHHTAAMIENAHGSRWPGFRSEHIKNPKTGKGWHIGYNGIIFPGYFLQTRAIGEETAAIKGYNQNGEVVHFALAGNFTKKMPGGFLVDNPTQFQLDCMRELKKLFPQVMIWNVIAHRVLQPSECYGSGLADDWARKVVQAKKVKVITAPPPFDVEPDAVEIQMELNLLQQILALITKLFDIQRRRKMGSIVGAKDCSEIDVRG